MTFSAASRSKTNRFAIMNFLITIVGNETSAFGLSSAHQSFVISYCSKIDGLRTNLLKSNWFKFSTSTATPIIDPSKDVCDFDNLDFEYMLWVKLPDLIVEWLAPKRDLPSLFCLSCLLYFITSFFSISFFSIHFSSISAVDFSPNLSFSKILIKSFRVISAFVYRGFEMIFNACISLRTYALDIDKPKLIRCSASVSIDICPRRF